MKNDWILDVLADLKSFAQTNGLPALADQLRATADLAAIEIASAEAKAEVRNGDECATRSHLGESGIGKRA